MKTSLVLGAWRLVLSPRLPAGLCLGALAWAGVCLGNAANAAPPGNQEPTTKNQELKPEPFRPVPGTFPPIEKALAYRGELVFVDHANRRGSLRIQGEGTYFRNAPHPFALLPYGMVRYHAAPADLRDVPLGTVMHALAYLPPDPKLSAVPVLAVDNRNATAGYSGKGIAPAENHVAVLEDEPSFCMRQGLVWKLKEVEVKNREGLLIATREPRGGGGGGGGASEEKLTFDAATRIWRGPFSHSLDELISEGALPADGKKALNGQEVLLGICWTPTPDGIFTRFHISDIWLDEASLERAAKNQTERHRAFIRKRWMPAWVDAVEYGKFGRATVTATLFGGMDPELYADFQKDASAVMNAVENTLKHAGGGYGPAHMASRGSIVGVEKLTADVPFLSSGVRIRFETDLVIEGIREGRVVRIRPGSWPAVNIPREEYVGDSNSPDDRFPSPAIFPKY